MVQCSRDKSCMAERRRMMNGEKREKPYNVWDAHRHPEGKGWVVDGEYGRCTYPDSMSIEEAIEAYRTGKEVLIWQD